MVLHGLRINRLRSGAGGGGGGGGGGLELIGN